MSRTLVIINGVIMAYMVIILVDLIFDRIEPKRGGVAWALQKTTHVLTEPYLKVLGVFTPEMKHGSVDWRGVFGIVILFVVFQAIRLIF